MKNEVSVRIGGIILNAAPAHPGVSLTIAPEYQKFLVSNGIPDIHLRYHYGSEPSLPDLTLVFDSGGPWRLYRQGEKFVIRLFPDPPTPLATINKPKPHRLAILDHSFKSVEVYVWPRTPEVSGVIPPENPDRQVSLDPFEYPLPDLLMLNFLAPQGGIILHACGVLDKGQGRLFVGVSGAGKSTIAELWKKTDAILLSDDRIIVRRINGRFWMFGTPWHGDAHISSPEGAPLERLYFLQHYHENRVLPLSVTEAATRLLVRCFPPFHDPAGMAHALELVGQLATEIPCYELGFVPDKSVIDFIRNLQ